MSSLLATEVWVRSRESVDTGEKEMEGRPLLLYRLVEDALLRVAAMVLKPEDIREEVPPLMRLEETGNLGESPKIFR